MKTMVGQAGLEPAMLKASDLQSDGVTNFPTDPYWWTRRDSNTLHLPCKGSALPIELRAHIYIKRLHKKRN